MNGGERTKSSRIVMKCCATVSLLPLNLGRFLVLANRVEGYSFLEQHTSLDGYYKPHVISTFQPQEVCDRPEALHSELRSMIGSVEEVLN